MGDCGIYSGEGVGGAGDRAGGRKGVALDLESDTVGVLGLIASLSQEKTFPKLLSVQTPPWFIRPPASPSADFPASPQGRAGPRALRCPHRDRHKEAQ